MKCYYNLRLWVCRGEPHREWSMIGVLYGFLVIGKIVGGGVGLGRTSRVFACG